jgi:hypothetical protein
MSSTETKSLPAYRIFSVLSETIDKKSVWQEIGSAWPNKDGQGLNLYFKARPLEGAQIVLRVPKPREDEVPAKQVRKTATETAKRTKAAA